MKAVLLTPPFTQLNTPYPATAYLKGFLNTLEVDSFQADLGLEVILELFSYAGLSAVFALLEDSGTALTDNGCRIFSNRKQYLRTIAPVISFLQNKNQTLAHTICAGGYLPRAARFGQAEGADPAFGTMGIHDRARHLATLYLEDLGDLISEAVDCHFGFSRYAERLARTATHFDELYDELNAENSLVSDVLEQLLESILDQESPDVVLISVPFPGNVFGAFKCGQYIKARYPDIKVVLGGGYANTELRRLYDERVFEFVDFITLDDGEAPLKYLLEYFAGKRSRYNLKRTFYLENGMVRYCDASGEFDIPQLQVGTPDYSDLLLDEYLSVIEVVNPMHRLWSDGRWNKLTLAHGCYWGKCTFCDVTLDYISRYEPVTASVLCDRIETIIAQTGQNGFHFVDEAAPPALLRDLALEILRRDLTVVWWTNIRFEKSFSSNLCRLLRAAGCIAVSGGLEVASDRLLDKMKKGVSVAQVARVAHAFSEAGVMVHAYLMYGFPTQTAQETIDSMEIVRQMVQAGIIQSGFWHQFAMTAHSPVGLTPEVYGVIPAGPEFGGFAENDMFHEDPEGARHEDFAEGLKLSIFNYMQGIGLEEDLAAWFDFGVPPTTVDPMYIEACLHEPGSLRYRGSDLLVWVGGVLADTVILEGRDAGESYLELMMTDTEHDFSLYFKENEGYAVAELIEKSRPENGRKFTVAMAGKLWKDRNLPDFGDFLQSESFQSLMCKGLLIL